MALWRFTNVASEIDVTVIPKRGRACSSPGDNGLLFKTCGGVLKEAVDADYVFRKRDKGYHCPHWVREPVGPYGSVLIFVGNRANSII